MLTSACDVGAHGGVDEFEAVLVYDGVLDRVAVCQLAQQPKPAARHRRTPHALAHRLNSNKSPLRFPKTAVCVLALTAGQCHRRKHAVPFLAVQLAALAHLTHSH